VLVVMAMGKDVVLKERIISGDGHDEKHKEDVGDTEDEKAHEKRDEDDVRETTAVARRESDEGDVRETTTVARRESDEGDVRETTTVARRESDEDDVRETTTVARRESDEDDVRETTTVARRLERNALTHSQESHAHDEPLRAAQDQMAERNEPSAAHKYPLSSSHSFPATRPPRFAEWICAPPVQEHRARAHAHVFTTCLLLQRGSKSWSDCSALPPQTQCMRAHSSEAALSDTTARLVVLAAGAARLVTLTASKRAEGCWAIKVSTRGGNTCAIGVLSLSLAC
jgi:hypothetical protein